MKRHTLKKIVSLACASSIILCSCSTISTPGDESGVSVKLGPNLALNKSFESTDNNAVWPGLTDGSWAETQQTCFATYKSAAFPKFVTVDLGTVFNLTHVNMGVPAFGSTKTVEVAVSEDGRIFSSVGRHEFAQGATQRHLFIFQAAPARYVRIAYIDNFKTKMKYDITYMFTTELEAYAAK